MKKILLGILFFGALSVPSSTNAQVPFGGLEVAIIPCTCSSYDLHIFSPLYLGGLPVSGALAYVKNTPTAFGSFLHPGAWALGSYTPGVPACWMHAGKFCFPVFSLGIITPLTGTSL